VKLGTLIDALTLYAVTASFFAVTLPLLWFLRALTTGKMVFLLFILDIALTIEAAIYSDIVLIALLHVVTVPSFFALIYFDLVQQHKMRFRCFICGRAVQESEPSESVNRFVAGERKEASVHSSCIGLDLQQRKTFSKNSFKKGIPE
jgi:hypothetical protein